MAVAIVLVVAASGASPVFAHTPRSAPAVEAVAAPPVAAAHPNKEVFGFALASSLGDATVGYPSWNFDLLSTVAFFGLHVDTAGQFVGDAGWNTWNSPTLTSFVALAHQHGTRVVLTVVLQDFSPNTPSMCAGLQHADATVAETVREVKAKGVDGVNVDYEGLDGGCGTGDAYYAQHAMTAFAQKMRAGLGGSAYLSIDTYAAAAGDGYGFFDIAGLSAYADAFFVMAYDLEYSNYSRLPTSCSRFCLGPTSPLTSYYYNDTQVAAQYMAVAGANKTILGVPYYGRKSCVGGAVANAYPTSGVIADTYLDASTEVTDPAVQPGSYVSHRETNSAGMERWDTWYNTSLGCTRELYWDDATSLGKKYDLVNLDRLRGVGLWNLNYGGGAPELWAALQSHFVGCSSVSLAASPASPQFTQATVTFTATASNCAGAQFRFWVMTPDGTWSVVQDYGTSNTFKWTHTATAGAYRVEVDARAATSGPYDAYTSINDTLQSCSAAALSANKPSPQPPGSVVTFTATSTCPATPQYRFWTGFGGIWTIAQDYGPSATFAWNTAGRLQGGYGVEVDVRDAGSTAAYDRVANVAYTLYAGPCTTPSLKAAPASPQGTGTQVVLTASTGGCPNPTYRFWVQPPGGAWQVVQAYGSSNTYTWNPGGAAGAFHLEVDVRDASSTASYEADTVIAYQLSPCSGARLTLSAPSPEPAGTAIVLTGAASCLGAPQFRFWVKAPGGGWVVKQDYSSTGTYSWDTTGLPDGVYGLEVDARDAGSTASYETVANLSFLVDACSGARLVTDKASPQMPGSSITLTGSATCLGTAEYRFWVRDPSGAWHIVQDYGPSATFTWGTAGLAQGAYGLEVDIRNHGSVDAYETVANLAYTLAVPVCGTPSLTAAPASPQGSGSAVTLSASVGGCPTPQYRFWVSPPGGGWTVVQDYGPSPTFRWTGTGVAGTYRLEVDVRNAGQTAAYDHVAVITYTLTACTSARLATNLASPQRAGTTVVLTGGASCQGAAQYRFWVRDLTGRWVIVQDFGPSNTFSWSTTGLPPGTYGLEVDVKNAGSTAAFETVANLTFVVT